MDTKTLLTKFVEFSLLAENVNKTVDDLVGSFIETLPTAESATCSHCGSHEVEEADFKDRESAKKGERGPAWHCKCGHWAPRKVG